MYLPIFLFLLILFSILQSLKKNAHGPVSVSFQMKFFEFRTVVEDYMILFFAWNWINMCLSPKHNPITT